MIHYKILVGMLILIATATQSRAQSVEFSLQNASVKDGWFEADATLKINDIGLNVTRHVKTKESVEEEIDLGNDIKLILKGFLKAANQACATGRVKKGFLGVDLPETCVAI